MKLSPTHVTQTLNQIRAEPVAENHPVYRQFSRLFGEHTFFVDDQGLNIVEPMASDKDDAQKMAVVRLVRLADWRDVYHSSLVPHAPQQTETAVMLSKAA
ncbi:hypothetical protein FZC33_03180 [Labrys sp. KNU-23]|uniref:hypothetical protein n=1 Tax=Labrys sp. KNU-23 TaxID=2789216 RepID=UPI0011EFEEF0|nr:hypothetical protein [Labrys sp. KNU-23]QEN85264.1 hypothetical protein FZC33_03180 [Labrys sp. KNU-23]